MSEASGDAVDWVSIGDEDPVTAEPSWLAACISDLINSRIEGDQLLTRTVQVLREVVTSRANTDLLNQLPQQHAEWLLNAMQDFLDDPDSYHSGFPAHFSADEHFLSLVFRVYTRLAQHIRVLPSRLFLQGISIGHREPVSLGGFADVFRGTWKTLPVALPVALKRLRVSPENSREGEGHDFLRTFFKEALIWRYLRHRYILPFLGIDRDTFADSRLLCMVSPWMVHGTILRYARKKIGMSERLRLLQEVAEGMSYLHSRRVVHGDIRALNIFLDNSLHVQLADFGLSATADKTAVGVATATKESGARRWMAPELINPEIFKMEFERTLSSDTFAFGGLGLEIFTGKPPFADIRNEATVILCLSQGSIPRRPTDEETFGQGIPDRVWRLMEQCWALSPADRPNMQDVAVVISDIHDNARQQQRSEITEVFDDYQAIQDSSKPNWTAFSANRGTETEHHITIEVITDAVFYKHEGFDLAPAVHDPLFQPSLPSFRVEAGMAWTDFMREAARNFGYATGQFCLWGTTKRSNGTTRPQARVMLQDFILDGSREHLPTGEPHVLVYLEMPVIPRIQPHTLDVMILLKRFDVSKQRLCGCGKIYAPPDSTESMLRSLVLRLLRWSSYTKITLFKELEPGVVELCKIHPAKGCQEYADGDIICFQSDLALHELRELEERGLYPDAKSYYEFLHSRAPAVLQANIVEAEFLAVGMFSESRSNKSLISLDAACCDSSTASLEHAACVGRCCVEIEYVLRRLVHHEDTPRALNWFVAYLYRSYRSARREVFLDAIQNLRGKYFPRILLLTQCIMDNPRCYMSSAPADADNITLMLIQLLVRLTNKSRQRPLALFIKGVVDFKDKPVAAGGFASVYIGSLDGKQVALKCLHITSTDPQGPLIRNKFYREMLLWSQLDHPYVLPFLGIYSAPGTRLDFPCMVSPWMSRGTIVEFAEKMDIRNAGREHLLAKTAEGLAYLHSIPIVHGDIKGVNIFVNDNGEPQLADFGLAVIGEASLGLTATTHGVDGTVRWMAPELIDDGESESDISQPRTVETDSYAFGCLCLEVFTLKAPFAHISRPTRVMIALIKGERPRRPSDLECRGQAVSNRLWSMLLEECWSRSPEKRPTLAAVSARLSAM